jgi:hypothetical protein
MLPGYTHATAVPHGVRDNIMYACAYVHCIYIYLYHVILRSCCRELLPIGVGGYGDLEYYRHWWPDDADGARMSDQLSVQDKG